MSAHACDLTVTTASGSRNLAIAEALTPAMAEAAELAANAWIKSLRGLDVDGVPLRDLFTLRGDSLWWFCELYLHKMQVLNRIYRTLLVLDDVFAHERVVALRAVSADPVIRQVAAGVCAREGIRFDGRRPGRLWRQMAATTLRAHYFVWRAARAASRAGAGVPSARSDVAAFVHSAFWRGGTQEQYVGPVLRELAARVPAGAMAAVGLGPRTSYRARTWRKRVADAGDLLANGAAPASIDTFAAPEHLRESRAVWEQRRDLHRAITNSQAIRTAAVIRGCDLWPLLELEWLGVAYLQLPWSAHVMDQLGAALDATRPRVAVTYAEAGGWGRALVLEARRRGVPTVGLQHGFIYRHWMNYLHEPDEMTPSPGNPADRGFPAPTLTLLYDRVAEAHLVSAGRFAPASLAVTGSPRLDDLAATAGTLGAQELAAVRAALGVPPSARMVLVAAKYTQMAAEFPALLRAIASMPDACLVVKPHPAERPGVYTEAAGGLTPVIVAPRTFGLAELTRTSDLLVTVNSTASLEAMVMGVPTLVVGLPNNLSPFVDAGVMDGVVSGGDIADALRTALDTGARRAAWRERAAMFMARERIQADGQAVTRAADAILALARR
jgi:hypothetical protein